MATDKQISQLIINKLTQAQYDAAEAAGNINEDELYFITDATNDVEIEVMTDEEINAICNTIIYTADEVMI